MPYLKTMPYVLLSILATAAVYLVANIFLDGDWPDSISTTFYAFLMTARILRDERTIVRQDRALIQAYGQRQR